MDMDTIEYLKTAAEHGPKDYLHFEAFSGWLTPKGHYVCARCATRILGRGCALPQGTNPVRELPIVRCYVCND